MDDETFNLKYKSTNQNVKYLLTLMMKLLTSMLKERKKVGGEEWKETWKKMKERNERIKKMKENKGK